MPIRLLCGLLLALVSPLTMADGIDALRAFVTGTQGASATFDQMVVSRNGKVTQRARGSFVFQKPGRFRFAYDTPYEQVIVSDGKKLWTWDKELAQVTVKSITAALGATPAALLTSDEPLEQNFVLRDAGLSEGMTWVEATPKQQEAGFEKVRIGLKDGAPLAMEVRDNFGQTTRLRFAGFDRKTRVDPALFRFTPPAGVDVVGD